MFQKDDIINGRYKVLALHSDQGGMGAILLVTDETGEYGGTLALKYCKETEEELRQRFKREVRLLRKFSGNTKIVPLLDSDLEYEPPYFVMPFYSKGDLRTFLPEISSKYEFQEYVFNQMVDCISELHRADTFHRDVKPQNFLRDGENIVVSDLGLSMEVESRTAFTLSKQYWGTQGYIPPEFYEHGGFKRATAVSDIYMLGKSFYHLLTARDPQYITDTSIPKPLLYLIEKCCHQKTTLRYQSTADLKQGLKAVYDVLLKRTDLRGSTDQQLSDVVGRLERENRYDIEEVTALIESISKLDGLDCWKIVSEFPPSLFLVLSQQGLEHMLEIFLPIYGEMVLTYPTEFVYAETVAHRMKIIFDHSQDIRMKSEALRIAIEMATRMNRFAAMDTCIRMICGIKDDDLAVLVQQVLVEHPEPFIESIEIANCENAIIRSAIKS
jgi:serine/threonine protein kinase